MNKKREEVHVNQALETKLYERNGTREVEHIGEIKYKRNSKNGSANIGLNGINNVGHMSVFQPSYSSFR